jgi:hypothetical protein
MTDIGATLMSEQNEFIPHRVESADIISTFDRCFSPK